MNQLFSWFKQIKTKLNSKPVIEGAENALDLEDDNLIPINKSQPPFMPVKDGFGYQGVLLYNQKDDTLLCHLCGEGFKNLGVHIRATHKLKVRDYKIKFGLTLGRSSSLMALGLRKQRRETRLKLFKDNPKYLKQVMASLSKARSPEYWVKPYTNGSRTMANKNRYGTCEAQLKDRLEKLVTKLGRVPAASECPFRLTLVRRFGSWNKALQYYGYETRKAV